MTERGNGPDDAIRVPGTDRVFNRQLMLVPLLAILAMTMMAISSINVALPSIELSIGASESDLQWLLSGYALAFGIVLVASGRLGDVFGRSTYFVIGVALFTLGSLGCSLAHTPALLNGIVHRDRLVIFGGGVPIRVDGVLVGAVGCSGGSAEEDAEIAQAGADAVAC